MKKRTAKKNLSVQHEDNDIEVDDVMGRQIEELLTKGTYPHEKRVFHKAIEDHKRAQHSAQLPANLYKSSLSSTASSSSLASVPSSIASSF